MAWIAYARRQRFSAKRRTAHLAGEADLRAPFERLVDTGVRLNELHSATELHEFLVDEVTELSGAERVLLVLDEPEGSARSRARSFPRAKTPYALLQAIAPWLDEARRTRATSLRYVPEAATRSTSARCLVAPLIAQQRVLGYLYADIDGTFGRFHDTDRDLLGMLAAQAAVALDNAQCAAGPRSQGRGAHGGARGVNARTEQRAGELAVINSIQQGIARQLDFQAIIDLVGDKLREIYDQGHRHPIFDPETESVLFPVRVRERRAAEPSIPDTAAGNRIRRLILRPANLVFNRTAAEQESARDVGFTVPGTDQSLSNALRPDRRRATGARHPRDGELERENAYGESDCGCWRRWRLSMSVALENARLFDEVQKSNAQISEALERETASNDILRVIAESPTDVRPVLDVIARHAALISGSDDAIIGLRDGDKLIVAAHHGDIPMIPIGQGIRFNRESVAGRAIIDGQPLAGDPRYRGRRTGVSGRRRRGRAVRLPRDLRGAADARGRGHRRDRHPQDQSRAPEREPDRGRPVFRQPGRHRDRERAPVRRDRPAAQGDRAARNTELAVINSIQEAWRARLDFQAIVDLVGDKVREVFDSADVGIQLAGRARRDERSDFCTRTSTARRLRPAADEGARYDKRCYTALRGARDGAMRTAHADYPACEHAGGRPGTDAQPVGRRHTDLRRRDAFARHSSFWRITNVTTPSATPMSACCRTVAAEHGRRAGERAPLRRDAASAEGDRAAQRRAGGDQQHPAGARQRARAPGRHRPRRRQAARGVRRRRRRHSDCSTAHAI